MYRFTFEHHVKPGEEELFLRKWKKSSDLIQKEHGSLCSRVFKCTSRSDQDSVYYIMADWEDRNSRDKAIAAIKSRGVAIENHNVHVNETIINEYELIDESLPTWE